MGVRIVALIAYLRTTLRLPLRRIQAYLQTIHGLHLSVRELVRLLPQVRRIGQPAVEHLKQQARASPILHADETGWREHGHNGYIWTLSTPGSQAVRYYEYDRSRAGRAQTTVGRSVHRAFGQRFLGGLQCLRWTAAALLGASVARPA